MYISRVVLVSPRRCISSPGLVFYSMSSTFSASFETLSSLSRTPSMTSPFSSPVQLVTPLALPEFETRATAMRHPRYFIQDDLAVFSVGKKSSTLKFDIEYSASQVEDYLFQVQRHFLDRESDIFPRGSGPDPISLPEVTKFEFESLLDYFYEGYVAT